MPVLHSAIHRFFLVIGFWAFLATETMSQETVINSFDEILFYGKEHLADFKIWEKTILQSENEIKISSGGLYPQIRAFGNFDDYLQLPVQLLPAEVVGGDPGTFTEIIFGTQYQLNVGIEASLPLVNTAAWNRVKSAKLRAEVVRNDVEVQKQTWTEQLVRSYYLSLLHQIALRLSDWNRKAADSILLISGHQFEQGIMDPLSFQRIKAITLDTRAQYELQYRNSNSSLVSLKRMIGMEIDRNLILTEELDQASIHAGEEEYDIYLLPEWKKVESNSRLAERKLLSALQNYLPTLSALGRYSQQAWSNNLKVGAYDWYETGLVGLRLEWVLFGGNQLRNQTKSSRWDRQVALDELARTKEKLLQEKYDLSLDLVQNTKMISIYQDTNRLFAENFRLAQIQFMEGQISVDELLQVQQELWDNQRLYLNSLADYLISKALVQLRTEIHFE